MIFCACANEKHIKSRSMIYLHILVPIYLQPTYIPTYFAYKNHNLLY